MLEANKLRSKNNRLEIEKQILDKAFVLRTRCLEICHKHVTESDMNMDISHKNEF